MSEDTELKTERRLATLENQQVNDRQAQDEGFQEVKLAIRELKVDITEEFQSLRRDLNDHVRKGNEKNAQQDEAITANTQFRERIAIYIGIAATIGAIIMTFLTVAFQKFIGNFFN